MNKRGWVNWLVLTVGLVALVKTGANVYRLWKTGERVKMAEKQVQEAERRHEELTSRLAEVQSPEFLEREARERFGLGREGEEILVIPEAGNPRPKVLSSQADMPNWKKWRKLYLGR